MLTISLTDTFYISLDVLTKITDNTFIMKAGKHNQTNQKPQSFCFEGRTPCLPASANIVVTAGLFIGDEIMTKLLLRLLLLIIFALGAFAALGIYIFKNDDPAWLCVSLLLGRATKDLC